MKNQMRKFGLIGFPLGHSFSKGYFADKFAREGILNCSYENYPLEEIDQLTDLIASDAELTGLNVTIPYKEEVLSLLDEIDDEAEKIGAVNTIKINRKGNQVNLKGFNTDVYGFEKPLLEVLKQKHNKALILGTGGAAKAVSYILRKNGISYKYVSRTPRDEKMLSYSALTPEIVNSCKLLINTSPIGMHPRIGDCPDIPYDAIGGDHILYDLIYNPEKTEFLKKGEEKKATLLNGLPMLYLQAERAWEIWSS